MITPNLTESPSAAKRDAMSNGTPRIAVARSNGRGRHAGRAGMARMILVAASATLLAGCITVNAPSKPIVIELNIKIDQNVVYSLAGDAAKTIDENKGIF